MTVITEGFERIIMVHHYSLGKTMGPNYGCSNKQEVTLLRLLCPWWLERGTLGPEWTASSYSQLLGGGDCI